MLQDLDAERAESDEHRGESDRLLDDLDRQLQEQIAQLERQRKLIVRIRSGQGEPDYPDRAAHALQAIEDFERTSHGQGFCSARSRATTRPRWAWPRNTTPMRRLPRPTSCSRGSRDAWPSARNTVGAYRRPRLDAPDMASRRSGPVEPDSGPARHAPAARHKAPVIGNTQLCENSNRTRCTHQRSSRGRS